MIDDLLTIWLTGAVIYGILGIGIAIDMKRKLDVPRHAFYTFVWPIPAVVACIDLIRDR